MMKRELGTRILSCLLKGMIINMHFIRQSFTFVPLWGTIRTYDQRLKGWHGDLSESGKHYVPTSIAVQNLCG